MTTRLDHIVICSETLEIGIDYVKRQLGVEVPRGGEHVLMGTHNCVMQLGREIYFEIIAINPAAPPPGRPRWFSMDNGRDRSAVKKQPGLITWVANTDHLENCRRGSTFPYAAGFEMSRGELNWKVTLPEDGTLPAHGLMPTLIEWRTAIHPANNMPDLGCRLDSLKIYHPYRNWLIDHLTSIQAEHLVEVVQLPKNQTPYMQAEINSPNGRITLKSVC